MNIESQITILIKTFERPFLLYNLLRSIKKFYPDINIIVVDDSKEKMDISDYTNVRYIRAPFNSGISVGRNIGLKNIKTPYFVLCDDDHVFNSKTDLEILYKNICEYDLDVVGGKVMEYNKHNRFEFNLTVQNKTLIYSNLKRKRIGPHVFRYDLIHNFFLAKTSKIKSVNGWDERLPLNEHTAFFLELKKHGIKVGFNSIVEIAHNPIKLQHYNQYRERDFFGYFLSLYHIEKVIKKDRYIVHKFFQKFRRKLWRKLETKFSLMLF
jgi:glycosyltransferase involved in cell wall biosynthesis